MSEAIDWSISPNDAFVILELIFNGPCPLNKYRDQAEFLLDENYIVQVYHEGDYDWIGATEKGYAAVRAMLSLTSEYQVNVTGTISKREEIEW